MVCNEHVHPEHSPRLWRDPALLNKHDDLLHQVRYHPDPSHTSYGPITSAPITHVHTSFQLSLSPVAPRTHCHHHPDAAHVAFRWWQEVARELLVPPAWWSPAVHTGYGIREGRVDGERVRYYGRNPRLNLQKVLRRQQHFSVLLRHLRCPLLEQQQQRGLEDADEGEEEGEEDNKEEQQQPAAVAGGGEGRGVHVAGSAAEAGLVLRRGIVAHRLRAVDVVN